MKNALKDVIISVKGLMGTDDNGDDIELVTKGLYDYKNGKAKFSYLESELTGMEGTKTAFDVHEGYASITRTGSVTMQMVFEEGKKNYFVYNTPYGAMTMGVDTHSVYSRLGENGGSLNVKYILDISGAMASRNNLDVTIQTA